MEQLREVEGVSAALTKQMKHIPHRILLTSLISLQIVSLDEANCTCVWISWRGSGLLCDTLCALDRTDSVSVATLAGDKILMERQTGIQSNRITDSSTSSNPLIEIMSEKDKNQLEVARGAKEYMIMPQVTYILHLREQLSHAIKSSERQRLLNI